VQRAKGINNAYTLFVRDRASSPLRHVWALNL
jgi:hypothetical protein